MEKNPEALVPVHGWKNKVPPEEHGSQLVAYTEEYQRSNVLYQLARVASQTRKHLERGRYTESTAKAKGRQAGRQAEHTKETRAGLLQKRFENNTRGKSKITPKKICKCPKKGKGGDLLQERQHRQVTLLTCLRELVLLLSRELDA
eukprot:1155758-Pelagomonas_calceolata.AAC.4